MHRSYGLQGSLKRRYKHPSPTSINGYHAAKKFLSQSPAKRPTFAFADESGYTTRLRQQDCTQGLTHRNTGRFRWGWYHYPRSVPHVHKHPRAGYQNGVLCRFWVLVGGAPKERREPRDSDALMRVAVPRRRGPAGLRDLFRFCRSCGLYTLRSELSVRARQGWYHYPRCALHVLETLDARLSKRLICRFLRLGSLH